MNSSFFIGTNLPNGTNILMGDVDGNMFSKNFDELSSQQKDIYQNLLNTIGLHATVNLTNFNSNFYCNIIIPEEIEINIVDIDFADLPQNKKDHIILFFDMISSLCD
jgi:hypothetical protein